MSATTETLQQWHNGIRIAQIGHLRAAARCRSLHRMLGVPVTVLSIAIGTSVFASLGGSNQRGVLIMVGAVSVLAAVLSGLQTFLNYGELAGKHQTAGVKYGRLRRRMEQITTTGGDDAALQAAMPEIRQAWDSLDEESPDLSQAFQDKAQTMVTKRRAPPNG